MSNRTTTLLLALLVCLSSLLSCVSGQTYNLSLGWFANAAATTQLQENNQAANDLHCDPIQQYSSLPAAGALFQSFSTYYDANTVTGKGAVVRMALYSITGSTWNLVVGTQTGSDLPLVPGTVSGGTLATSAGLGPLYYPNGATSATIYPGTSYSVCFTNTAEGMGQGAAMFLWPAGATVVNYAYSPYSITQPLPNPYPAAASAGTATDTWQIWFTVAAPGTAPAGLPVPTPAPPTPQDYASGCFGIGAQTVWTLNYVYTMGCNTEETAWPLGLGVSCPQQNANGTFGGFMIVNLTLIMLSSSTPINGTAGTTNAAYQVCSLLPGSQRSVGVWLSATQGLQWTTSALSLTPNLFASEVVLSLGFNNWYYPNSAPNGANGPASGPNGLAYYFDEFGITYTLSKSWQGVSVLNLFTSSGDVGNWVIPEGGIQLMEEIGAGPFGVVTEKNWQITTSSQPFTGCAQYGNNTQVWSFNYSYVAVCNVLFTYPGCVVGSGSYTVNLTLLIQTPTVPVVDNGVNSPFVVCALLPGSTRTATLNPTGNNPTTTTTSLTLATPTADLTDFNYNSFFYPLSGSNGAAGAADGALGLYDNNMTHLITQYYYFDNEGMVMVPSTPWVVNQTAYTYINLCSGNGAVPVVGSQLMEELSFGQLGQIPNNASWSLSSAMVGSVPQTYTGCPTSSYNTQLVDIFTFNMQYTALCTSQASLPGCLTGTAASSYNQGYYILNLTLVMLTAPAPSANGAETFNAAYQVCQLLPGSQRSTWVSLTGYAPVYSSTPLTLLQNPSIHPNPTNFTFDNWYYPLSYSFGSGSGTNQYNDALAYGAEFYFDNFGIIYQPSTPFLNNAVINLCTGNPTTGSPNPNTLVEEFPNGVGGVISGWSISSSSQRWLQQSSFYFSWSAAGPASSSGNAGWASVISGVLTVVNTATPNVYTIIGMTATRQTTNFGGTVTNVPLTLVGAMMAGNNNNLLYINSAIWPQGMDSQGWGYTSNASSLFPAANANSATLPANSNIQLLNGVMESSNQQTVLYANPLVSFTPHSSVSSPPASPSLPTSSSVSSGSSSNANLSKGAVAGIVIGCSIGFGLLCALCTAFLLMQSTRRDDHHPMKQQPTSELSKVEGRTEDSRTGEVELR